MHACCKSFGGFTPLCLIMLKTKTKKNIVDGMECGLHFEYSFV